MDPIQTVAGADASAEATVAALHGQGGEVQAVDQMDAAEMQEQAVELVDSAGADEVDAAQPDEPTGEQVDAAGADESPVDEVDAAQPGEPTEEQADGAQMGELPVEDWDYQRPKRGEVRSGVILAVKEQEIIVDVGGKRDGIVPYADMQRLGDEELAKLSEGDEVLVYVLRPEDQEGNLLLSLNMARQEQSWRRAQQLADSGEVWEGEVIGYNKGGLVIPVDEIRGFVPASQVPGFPQGLNQEERLQRLSEMVGETLQVKVIEINRRKRRLILSATTALRQWRKQQRERLLGELREGEVRRGTVSSVCSFGAFVDLGGADGLIHLSELSWRRVRHPREVVKVGQEVEVYVLRLDHEKQRIGLSLKRLQPEPWALVEDKYELGQLIEGVVTNVVDFGAFAEIEDGIEGLIHVSELADAPVSHPKEVVKKGDLLLLRIIRIDTRRKRLGLSLKRVLEAEWAEWAAKLAVDKAQEEAARAEEEKARQVEAAAEAEAALEAEPVEPSEPAETEEEEPAVQEAPEVIEEEEPLAVVVDEVVEVLEPPEPASYEEEEPVAVVVDEVVEVLEPAEPTPYAEEPAVMVVEEVIEVQELSGVPAVEEGEEALMAAPEEPVQIPELVEEELEAETPDDLPEGADSAAVEV